MLHFIWPQIRPDPDITIDIFREDIQTIVGKINVIMTLGGLGGGREFGALTLTAGSKLQPMNGEL